jgi:plastocyanin
MKSRHNSVRWSAVLLSIVAGVGVTSCGNDNPASPTPPATADVTITIAAQNGASSFTPNPAQITEGQSVAWKNSSSDNNTHTATSTGVFDTGNISLGATSAPITLHVAGSYPYHCSIHPGMTGTLIVNSHVVTIVAMTGSTSFSPNPIVIKAGESIVWKNSEPSTQTHTATADLASAFQFDTGDILSGATSTKITFPTAGTFGYHCTPHPTMVGTVTVTP